MKRNFKILSVMMVLSSIAMADHGGRTPNADFSDNGSSDSSVTEICRTKSVVYIKPKMSLNAGPYYRLDNNVVTSSAYCYERGFSDGTVLEYDRSGNKHEIGTTELVVG